MSRRDIIRVGDWVKVVTPKIFIRCGYPLDRETAVNDCILMFEADLRRYFYCQGLLHDDKLIYGYEHKALSNVLRSIAYLYQQSENFGGRERTIYTEDSPRLDSVVVQVAEIKFVVTGSYFAPSGSEDCYEPGGLSYSKRHKILGCNYDPSPIKSKSRHFDFAIEAANVERIGNRLPEH